MNCPWKKNRTRILALTCSLTLLASLLAGCKFGKPDPTEGSQPTPNLNIVESKPEENATTPTETTAPVSDKNTAVVTQQLNVLSTPSEEGNVIGYLDAGTVVEILQEETVHGVQWGLIRQGWIAMEFVEKNYTSDNNGETSNEETKPEETQPEETQPEKEPEKETNTKGVITASELNIRKEANTTSKVVGNYIKGDVVTILETKDGWGRTNKGWIKMQYVNTSADAADNKDTNKDDNKDDNKDTNTNGTKGVVTVNELNIRKEPSTNGDRVGSYKHGDRITILETKNGWGRTDKGWISLQYIYQDGTSGTNSCKGVITGNQLNVRSGPGTDYDRVNTLNYGKRVTVLERIKIGNTTWGCIDGGWISMEYVYVDGTTGEGSGTGTVTGDGVNIRSGPGTDFGAVGSLNKGNTVKIHAQLKIGDMIWGCTDKGWVSMKYVDMND